MKQIISLLPNDYKSLMSLIVFLSIFVEFSPIKINPVSYILRKFKNIFDELVNENTNDKFESIETRLNDIAIEISILSNSLKDVSNRIDSKEINDMRRAILDFANELMHKRERSKEDYDNILDICSQYETIIHSLNKTNGQIDRAFNFISNRYEINLENNTFLE